MARVRCRGSKWLDYDSWRMFVEDLSWRKRLSLGRRWNSPNLTTFNLKKLLQELLT
jgi:hypothetical protein